MILIFGDVSDEQAFWKLLRMMVVPLSCLLWFLGEAFLF
jgi:hypothetical protein